MGCTVREKHVRPNRKTRSVKSEFDPCCLLNRKILSKSMVESSLKHLACYPGLLDSGPDSNPSGSFEENCWGYCTDEQLENLLLRHLEDLYDEAISKLVALGYEEDVALRAILSNGYCYGGMDDALTNILQNSVAYLNSSTCEGSNENDEDESETIFTDLRELEEYSLAGMIYLLQQVKPHLSKGDAMWCLLMSELHVGRASTIDLPSSGSGGTSTVNGVGDMAPTLCRFHGGWGFGKGRGGPEFSGNGFSSNAEELTVQREIDCPTRFNLSPSMKSMLRENVEAFAAGYRASMEQKKQMQSGPNGNSLSCTASPTLLETSEQPSNPGSEESVSSMLEKFWDLKLDDNVDTGPEELKDDTLIGLVRHVQDLRKQLKDRKDWAQKKAMQAAQRVSDELNELKSLRIEREEIQRLKKGKLTREDSTMKRLSDMENAIRKASSQVDKGNAIARTLDNENAEIRAEMEASKLSASESLIACMEASKKEKKCLKKLLVWEKQKMKLQQEITSEKEKIKALNRAFAQITQEEKEYEAKWRQEQKAKEQALAQVEEEQRSKEATEASNKRKVESLRLKMEIDFQRHKDDLQRLEQELSRLNKASSDNNSHTKGKSGKSKGETMSKLLEELDRLDGSYEKEEDCDRECLICMKDEVSIVFLPCAHQVVCVSCSDSFMGSGKATCPCCRAPVQQRIRVFGATS